jgi:hypothetical protein
VIGTPGLLAFPLAGTTKDPEKVGRVKYEPLQTAGGVGKEGSRSLEMPVTEIGTFSVLVILKTTQSVTPGTRAPEPEQVEAGYEPDDVL